MTSKSSSPKHIKIGRFTYGYENISIRQYGEGANLEIGSFCSIASCITIFLGGNHRTDWITTYPFGHVNIDQLGGELIKGHPSSNGDIIIGNDVWIGHGVTIMSGVTIGDGAVIAANSTVTKSIGPYEIHGGNPAKIIKKRFEDSVINELLGMAWWNLSESDIKKIAPDISSTPTAQKIKEIRKKINFQKINYSKIDEIMKNHSDQTKFNICIMQPSGYIHSQGLLDPARYFRYQIRKITGSAASITKNRLKHDHINFIFGAHLGFDAAQKDRHTCIFVNLEQIGVGGATLSKDYFEILATSAVIDYDANNVSSYTKYIEDVPIAHFTYAPYLNLTDEILPLESRPIDILFFGSMNDRRKKIIERIEKTGLNVSIFDKPLYCEERDFYIRQAKSVLNCHFYESSRFEQVRVSHCLSLGTPVIAERTEKTNPTFFYEDVVSWFNNENIEEFFSEFFGKADWLKAANNQLENFSKLDAAENFSEIIEFSKGYHTAHKEKISKEAWEPTRMNLGSGKDYKLGWLNVDIIPRTEPDIVADLSQPLKLPQQFNSSTYGKIILSPDQFDIIYANNVLEHVPDLVCMMSQCLLLLKEDGLLEIEVPYEKSLSAWQDPTHIRAMNENSWIYYTEWFWYLGWFSHRFEVSRSNYLDNKLNYCAKDQAAFMRITLKKIKTTQYERTIARTMQANWIIPDDEI